MFTPDQVDAMRTNITQHSNDLILEEGSCNEVTSIELAHQEFKTNLKLFPNPNDGNFQIEYAQIVEDGIHFSIFNMEGRIVLSNTFSNAKQINKQINLTNFNNGVYYVVITSNEKTILQKIVVIQ